MSWLAGRPGGLKGPLATLVVVAGLAGVAAVLGAELVGAGIAIRARTPRFVHAYVVVLARRSAASLAAAREIPEVSRATLRRVDEVAGAGGMAGGPERLRVVEVDVSRARGEDGARAALDRLRRLGGVVDVIDANAAERRRFAGRRALAALLGGAALLLLAGVGYGFGVVGAAGALAREYGREIALQHVLGADRERLWLPLALVVGAAAALGVLIALVAAFGLLELAFPEVEAGAARGAAALWALGGGVAWLAGTAGLASAAARREVIRAAARGLVAAWIGLVLLAGSRVVWAAPSVCSVDPSSLTRREAVRALRRAARDLAVARHARHLTVLSLAAAERSVVRAAARGARPELRLASAWRRADRAAVARWERRELRLERRRARERERLHLARELVPEIAPRRRPVGGAVAVRFGEAGRAPHTTAFRGGVGLRVAPGDTVVAAAGGRVAFARTLGRAGAVIVVDHGHRTFSVYGRLDAPLVAEGQAVAAGQPLARAGRRSHLLYFSVRRRGRAVAPIRWVDLLARRPCAAG